MFTKTLPHAVITAAFASASGGAQAQAGGPVPSFGPDLHCVYSVTQALPPLPPAAQLPIQMPAPYDYIEILVQRDRVRASAMRFPAYDIKIAPRKEILVSEQVDRRTDPSWDNKQPNVLIKDRATGGARFYLYLPGHQRTRDLRAIASVISRGRHNASCRIYPEGSFGTL